MAQGNWIRMSKNLRYSLPKDRPFSEVEAAYSLQIALDCNQDVSVAGLAARWMWSRRRVSSFIERMGAMIVYKKDTSNLQNQRGQIAIQITDRYRADNGQISLIGSNTLDDSADRYRADSGQIADRSSSTINKTKTKTKDMSESPLKEKKENPSVDTFYALYPKKQNKEGARKSWAKINPDDALLQTILAAVEAQSQTEAWTKDKGKFIPMPATWLNNRRWEDQMDATVNPQKTCATCDYMAKGRCKGDKVDCTAHQPRVDR